jgi:hypothetical protein
MCTNATYCTDRNHGTEYRPAALKFAASLSIQHSKGLQ